ncbi:MAG: hypothetical protein ACYSSO_15345 [Planctomycetota bacterium]|jgi:hypothetical protein
MEWLKENAAAIGSILLAAYALARAIVALTPTPKDDEALKKVNVFVRALAKTFGLDLKQGVKKK